MSLETKKSRLEEYGSYWDNKGKFRNEFLLLEAVKADEKETDDRYIIAFNYLSIIYHNAHYLGAVYYSVNSSGNGRNVLDEVSWLKNFINPLVSPNKKLLHERLVSNFSHLENVMDKTITLAINNGVFIPNGLCKLMYKGECVAYRISFRNKSYDIATSLASKVRIPLRKVSKEKLLYLKRSHKELITDEEEFSGTKAQEITVNNGLLKLFKKIKIDWSQIS